jgi:hypothetical protein
MFDAVSTTEPALARVFQARHFEALCAGASSTIVAWTAQVAERRDTGKNEVRTSQVDLLAEKTFGALLEAEVGTNEVAHVFETKARQTVIRPLARLAEAAAARLATAPLINFRRTIAQDLFPRHKNEIHSVLDQHFCPGLNLMLIGDQDILSNNVSLGSTGNHHNRAKNTCYQYSVHHPPPMLDYDHAQYTSTMHNAKVANATTTTRRPYALVLDQPVV